MAKPDWVQPYLAIGPRPNDEQDWQTLQEEGISMIIDLNDDSLEASKSRELGIQHKGMRIDDPPRSPEGLVSSFGQAVKWIDDERSVGGRVYLHYTAGQQRSPTLAMAYLMAKGKSREQAERLVKAARLGVWAGPVGIDLWRRALDIWTRQLATEER